VFWTESALVVAQILGLIMVAGFMAHVGFPRGSRISRVAGVVMVVFFFASIAAGAIGVQTLCCGG
jgi:hypothetical protein